MFFIARKDTHFYITNPTVNYYLDTTNPIIYSRQTSDEELFMTAITGLHRILLDFTGFYWILATTDKIMSAIIWQND